MVRRHPVLSYVIIACVVSWLGWLPSVLASRGLEACTHPAFQLATLLAGLGPALAAIIVTGSTQGRQGVRNLFARLGRFRGNRLWHIAALLSPVMLFSLAGLIDLVWFKAGWVLQVQPVALLIGAFVTNLILNVWEEIGWRGLALQHLLSSQSPLGASLLVGVAWGIWHLPLFLIIEGAMAEVSYPIWFLGLLTMSILYTALYSRTEQSLLAVTLFHAAINTVGGLLYAGTHLSLTLATVLIAALVVLPRWRHWIRTPRPEAGSSNDKGDR